MTGAATSSRIAEAVFLEISKFLAKWGKGGELAIELFR